MGREKLFAALKGVFANFGFAFGICLVHTHCKLEDKDIIFSRRNLSELESTLDPNQYYPER